MSTVLRLLPDHVRDADTSGQLEAFLNGVEAAVANLRRHLDDCDLDVGVPGVLEPVDPRYCRADWLPWLATLLGADIAGLTVEQARWYLTQPGRAQAGSDAGLIAAVAATLTGTRYVRIDHPSLWTITVTISADDVLNIDTTTAAAIRHKPAGTSLTIVPLAPYTLAQLDAKYASLAAITATGKTLDQLKFG